MRSFNGFAQAIASLGVLVSSTSVVVAQDCGDSQVTSAVIAKIISTAQANPSWLARMNFWVPYFRMKEVEYTVLSTTAKGKSRTGPDCQIVLRMVPPPDVPDGKTVRATFNYIIQVQPSGSFVIDMY